MVTRVVREKGLEILGALFDRLCRTMARSSWEGDPAYGTTLASEPENP